MNLPSVLIGNRNLIAVYDYCGASSGNIKQACVQRASMAAVQTLVTCPAWVLYLQDFDGRNDYVLFRRTG